MAESMNADISSVSERTEDISLAEALSGEFAAISRREIERRRALRVKLPFPAIVRGMDHLGDRFLAETVLDNMSACGLYMTIGQQVGVGSKLFVVVQLSFSPPDVPSPRVAVKGTVVRVEPQPDGEYGVGVEFTRHRFLYAA